MKHQLPKIALRTARAKMIKNVTLIKLNTLLKKPGWFCLVDAARGVRFLDVFDGANTRFQFTFFTLGFGILVATGARCLTVFSLITVV
jgi:hypothetical protein